LLLEALSFRTTLKDQAKLAETENSLGMLAQKQANLLTASPPNPCPHPHSYPKSNPHPNSSPHSHPTPNPIP